MRETVALIFDGRGKSQACCFAYRYAQPVSALIFGAAPESDSSLVQPGSPESAFNGLQALQSFEACPLLALFPSSGHRILGKKPGMSQFFNAGGQVHPVTLDRGRSLASKKKKHHPTQNPSSDGYTAVRLVLARFREKLVTQPSSGHLAKSGSELLRHLTEYRLNTVEGFGIGEPITVERFEAGQRSMSSGDTTARLQWFSERQRLQPRPHDPPVPRTPQPGSTVAAPTPGGFIPASGWPAATAASNHHEGSDDPEVDTERNLLVVKVRFRAARACSHPSGAACPVRGANMRMAP